MQLSPTHGTFSIPGALSLEPRADYASVVLMAAKWKTSTFENGSGRKWLTILNVPDAPWFVTLSLIFEHETLQSIQPFLSKEELVEGRGWDDWSEAKELELLEVYQGWLQQELGDARGFPWGGVHASYDPRNGASLLLISYQLT